MLALFPFFGKSLSEEDRKIAQFMERSFGYRPKKIDLFRRALTHKSVAHNNQELSNERLEFLGDAILDAVIAELLFAKYPDEDEGYLTKIKSKVVSRRTLSLIAEEMEIGKVLRYNKGRSIKMATIEGNAFEALVGAMYLDADYQQVKRSLNQHILKKYIDLNQILEEEIDFKSKLFIWSQKNRLPLVYEVISEENLGASWSYTVRVVINEQEFGRGQGTSKKRAEQAASKETLQLLGEL